MFIFSEDPPLKTKGHGLSVLLYNLFAGVEFIEEWFTFLSNKSVYRNDIRSDLHPKIRLIDFNFHFGLLRKYNKVNLFYNEVLFLFFSPRIILSLRKKSHQPIFIPIGASPLILYKIWLIGIFTKNPIWLYIVDDLNEIAIRQHRTIDKILCRFFLKKVLEKADVIYAITENLADKLSTESGKKVRIILPCFQEVARIRRDIIKKDIQKITFVFTGGLSFLYNEALKIFSDFLNRFQSETGIESILIIQTYSSRSDFDLIKFDNPHVSYRTSDNREELYRTYNEADAFIVPYSFELENRKMISTSFPQKIAQIIQLGIPILVFGPSYGSVVNFFKKNNLCYVIDENSYELFKKVITKLRQDDSEVNIQNYRIVYDANFSQHACLRQLLDINL